MKIVIRFFSTFIVVIMPFLVQAADIGWPRIIKTGNGHITLYQPQVDALNGNKLSSCAAVAVTLDDNEPVFGAVWCNATFETDRDSRTLTWTSTTITKVKFSGINENNNELKQILETEIPKLNIAVSMDRVITSLGEAKVSAGDVLSSAPPEIIYVNEPTLLVPIDGNPKLQKDSKLGLQRVVNTPFVILQSGDKNFYLYVSGKWFKAASIVGLWAYTRNFPADIEKAGKEIAKADESDDDSRIFTSTIPIIMVSTKPTELIQSNGRAEFRAIRNTSLQYMSNSEDDIFLDAKSEQYYVLLSGRWYASSSLGGPWLYVAGDDLPDDFKKIPEGSAKDIVLASIPGTAAAKEAVADAQMPQISKINRKKATTTVAYDGAPRFEAISGTGLMYAVNTASTVLKEENNYYVVDNAVWFRSGNASGPWTVATERPEDVDNIPADHPAYNVKFVYIYEAASDYVYVGYTPGYLGCYVHDGCVVYGTGFQYESWLGTMYYPRPVTWGYSMHYNPWTGWSTGIGVNVGYFRFGFGYNFHYGNSISGGWWGPPAYHPPFHFSYSHYYGPARPTVVAPHNNIVINNYSHVNVNANISNNVYNSCAYVVALPPSLQNPGMIRSREANNVYVGHDGNIYRRAADGQVQECRNDDWKPAQNAGWISTMQQNRERGQSRAMNFQQSHTRYMPEKGAGDVRRR